MSDINVIRAEIEHTRRQVERQTAGMRQLRRAGISTGAAEAQLDRLPNKIDDLCAERDRLMLARTGLP